MKVEKGKVLLVLVLPEAHHGTIKGTLFFHGFISAVYIFGFQRENCKMFQRKAWWGRLGVEGEMAAQEAGT